MSTRWRSAHVCPDCGNVVKDCCGAIVGRETHLAACPIREAARAIPVTDQLVFLADQRRYHVGHLEPKNGGGEKPICDYGCGDVAKASYERVGPEAIVNADEDAVCPGLFAPKPMLEPSSIHRLEASDGIVH